MSIKKPGDLFLFCFLRRPRLRISLVSAAGDCGVSIPYSADSGGPLTLRENLHQSNPPITTMVTPRIRPRFTPGGESGAVTGGVTVGEGGREGEGDGVIVTGLGVNVAVAGGVTSRSNFCSGRITEAAFRPFQVIRSASGTL